MIAIALLIEMMSLLFIKWIIFFHLASSLIVVGLALKNFKSIERNLWLYHFTIWFFFPLVGPWFCLILRIKKDSSDFENRVVVDEFVESEEGFFKEMSANVISDSHKENSIERLAAEISVQPYIDILSSNRLDQQRMAIARLRQEQSNESIAILKLGQKSATYEVRYLSTIALSAIERDWDEQIKVLENEIEKSPKDYQLRNELVFTYMKVFNSKLFSPRIGKIYLKKAVNHAVMSLQIAPEQAGMLMQLVKINLYTGKYDHALKMINRVIELQPEEKTYHFWKAEILYHLKDFVSLTKECMELDTLVEKYPRFRENVEYWANQSI